MDSLDQGSVFQGSLFQKRKTEHDEVLEERWELAILRLREIGGEVSGAEGRLPGGFCSYFAAAAGLVLRIADTWEFLCGGGLENAPLPELEERNRALYEELLPGSYGICFANPEYAAAVLDPGRGETDAGTGFGTLLAAVYYELRSMIGCAYDGDLEGLVIRAELLLEIYSAFEAARDAGSTGAPGFDGFLPVYEEIRRIFYWYKSDYREIEDEKRIRGLVDSRESTAARILAEADLTNPRYLYAYGTYITENERELVSFLKDLPDEELAKMADTFTEGYRIGFEVTGKDLSKKQIVQLMYPVGFERMLRRAVSNFQEMGLRASAPRSRIECTEANRQADYDHKNDQALWLDKDYVNRSLECSREALEHYRTLLRGYAGPAVVERFGERSFEPENSPAAARLTDAQNKLSVEFQTKAGALQREYILEEERSFTIIAFPIPEITESLLAAAGERTDGKALFAEFFREIIRVNTLDYALYRDIQAKLIEALDQADYCEVRGQNGNRTSIRVNLWKRKDPERETIFENCVADVNIPVGEVFTSPVLEGTNGTLHVTRVYLDGLEYRDLEIRFEDGMIADFSCGNFESAEENRRFVSENVLFRHETLPIGEFAIGTNTTAYTVARRYGVEDKLPILIAEKTGPHFAVGDTCYAHDEEIRVYNPDGKEIVAKENSRSALRKSDPAKAYFNCHTDITIPYEELGELTAVRADGTRIPILRGGRFVLPGTEPLNLALEG